MADFNITFVPFAPGTTDSQGQRISSIDPRLSRTHYFDGRLLKASDLTRDQIYLDERALEIGQVLGSGIARGLDIELVDNYRLRVSPGLAVAPSGRVLQLVDRTLEVNLGNSALIATLNQDVYRRFKRGLYLVALQYAEVGSDSAEAYPADLASARRFRFNSFAEGVELVLVPLAVPLSQTSEVAARAGLVPEFIGFSGQQSGQRPELSDEAVALGLLALEQGRPLWLDKGLVRRPLRQPGTPDALQQDLAVHYDELLETVLDTRNAAGLGGGFAASKYFRLLPPRGRLPKAAVNPVNGSQTYFPAGYEVSIAPVRRDDLPAILRESAGLAPMDLEKDADADIMVLVPLSNSEFAWRARSLERGATAPRDAFGLGRLLAIDRLALRLRPSPKPHAIDTDAEVWKAIWDAAKEEEILFVRRPPRAAETNVSAVVLARGFDLPAPGVDLSAYNRVMEKELAEARVKLDETRLDLRINRDDFARRLRNLKLDPAAPAQELADQLKALEAERDTLAARVKELEAGGSGSSADLEEAKARIDKLTAQLEAAKKQIAELQAAAGTATSTELAAVLEKNALLARELEAAKKQLVELQAAGSASANVELAEAKAAVDKLNRELEVANKRITELQATSGGGSSELDAARIKVDALTRELEAANKTITELRAAAATATNAELDAAKARIGELSNALVSANREIEALKAATATSTTGTTQPGAAISLTDLAKLRPATDAAGTRALAKLDSTLANRPGEVAVVADILMLLDRRYDPVIWPTLLSAAAEPGRLAELRTFLVRNSDATRPAGGLIADAGANFGLSASLMDTWKRLG
jgi:hypothetical protein